MRPGSGVWRKITSRAAPCRARQSRTRRSSVRRTRSSGKASGSVICRWRRSVTACTAGSCSRIGSSTGSHTAASGSGTVRPRSGLALGRQAGIGLDPARGALAEPGPGGGGALAVTKSVLHVGSHLLVGDGFARHVGTSVWTTEIPVVPARSGQHPTPSSPEEDDRAAGSSLRAGYARPPAGASGQLGCRRRTRWLSLISCPSRTTRA